MAQDRRFELLPRWIRFFGWLFLLMLPAMPLLHVVSFLYAERILFAIFGLEYEGAPTDAPALVTQALLALQGIAAFGLLWGRPWGLDAGLVAGCVGVAVVIATNLASWRAGGLPVSLEPLLQVPFVVVLLRRRGAWHAGGQEVAV